MKKRIWNQLKKAVMITAAVGILGAGAVSAAEFEAAELYVPAEIGRASCRERV